MAIKSALTEQYLVLTSDSDTINPDEIEGCFEQIQNSDYEAVILDFPQVNEIGLKGLRVLTQMMNKVVQNNSKAYVIVDGAAELLNMIIGQSKIKLNEKGFKIRQAIPSVVRGENLEISPSSSSSLVIPFSCDLGEFYLEISTNAGMLKPSA